MCIVEANWVVGVRRGKVIMAFTNKPVHILFISYTLLRGVNPSK